MSPRFPYDFLWQNWLWVGIWWVYELGCGWCDGDSFEEGHAQTVGTDSIERGKCNINCTSGSIEICCKTMHLSNSPHPSSPANCPVSIHLLLVSTVVETRFTLFHSAKTVHCGRLLRKWRNRMAPLVEMFALLIRIRSISSPMGNPKLKLVKALSLESCETHISRGG